MKTLDELLSERAQSQFQDELAATLDLNTWTTENRDSKFLEIRTIAEGITSASEEFVKDLLSTEVEGKSVLWHKICEQFMIGEIELLRGFRDTLDSPNTAPYEFLTHEWVSKKIKERLEAIQEINEKINREMSLEAEAL